MKHPFTISFALLFCLTWVSCVQFRTISLYDGEEKVPPPEKPGKISQVVEPVIFEDNPADVWGLEEKECITGKLNQEITYSGDAAIEVRWNRYGSGCEWTGFGIGWDGWAGKDLTEVIPYAAVQMKVRTTEGKMYGFPCVLTLEDYSGVMAFSYVANKYFERAYLDEDWQTINVPLYTFNDEGKGIDMGNIKQLQFELQQSGGVIVDDVKLVFYKEEPQEPWMEEEKLPDPASFPITLFDDEFINDNGWGIVKNDCQEATYTMDDPYKGAKAVTIKWDYANNKCDVNGFGVSWHKWRPVDMTSVINKSALEFYLKNEGATLKIMPVQVHLMDYNRVTSSVALDGSFSSTGDYPSDWVKVTIPLSSLKGNADLTNIKHIVFRFQEQGSASFDAIRLVEYNVN